MELPSPAELYQKTREDLLKRQLSNNENFDRSILTLSSAALALSVTFMKSGSSHHCFALLLLAWIGFVLSIISTIVSFLTSQRGILRQLELAENYYLKNDESALTARNSAAEWTDRLAYVSATSFVFGIFFLLVYFSSNLPNDTKGQSMVIEGGRPSMGKLVENGSSIPQLQKVEGGASIPGMQAVLVGDKGVSMQATQFPTQPTSQGDGANTGQSRD